MKCRINIFLNVETLPQEIQYYSSAAYTLYIPYIDRSYICIRLIRIIYNGFLLKNY